MKTPVYYVGTPAEVEHHARPLFDDFDVRIEDVDGVLLRAQPGDVCIFYNEFYPRYRAAWEILSRRQCPTLYALDGILEWRCLWEFPTGISNLWSARPILSNKVACVGRSQARIFESWGYSDLCEVVGVPRFDRFLGRAPRVRRAHEPFKILVLTAKAAGFNQSQWQRAAQSLKDLKAWLESHSHLGSTAIQPVWRITHGLDVEVGVDNALSDTTGQDLAQVLTQVDAVITTPSTSMLEGMLQHVPVALLDYNNAPHLVPAAWRITAQEHFDQVIPQLLAPPREKLDYQRYLLHDALECASPALPRLCQLIYRMDEIGRRCLSEGRPIAYPAQLLPRLQADPPARSLDFDYAALFPENSHFSEIDVRRLQAVVGDLQDLVISLVKQKHELREQVQQISDQLLIHAAAAAEECLPDQATAIVESGPGTRFSQRSWWKAKRESARLARQLRGILKRTQRPHDDDQDDGQRRAA